MKNNHYKLAATLPVACAIYSLALSQAVFAQTPIDATNGIEFGNGVDDPAMGKSSTTEDLDIGMSKDRVLNIFSGGDSYPYFKAGEGNEGTVEAGKWYRIAKTQGALRANAKFILMDDIGGGGHSTAVFRAGISYGDSSGMGLTLLSHTKYILTSFPEIRILEAGTYDVFYLEVKAGRSGSVRYAIQDNLANSGWSPVDWTETVSIPAGYTSRSYDINKLFVVGDYQNRFSIARGGAVDITGSLKVNGSSVVTQATAPSLLAGQYIPFNGDGSSGSLLMEGINGGAGAIPQSGSGSRMMWYPEKSAFRVGLTTADHWDDINVGNFSVSTGLNTMAYGDSSTAMGEETIAFGYGSTALGGYTIASGTGSLAIGFATNASSYATCTMGQYNEDRFTEAGKMTWLADDQHSVLEVGIGTSEASRKNAFTVLQDGSIELGKATATDNSVPLRIKSDGSVILSKAQGDISMGVFGQ